MWTGSRDWVVLIHETGVDCDLDRWRPLIPALIELGLSVCAFDLRGHGASDGAPDDHPAVGDVRSMIRFAKANGADVVIVIAAGDAAWKALNAVETEATDGIIAISATTPSTTVGRLWNLSCGTLNGSFVAWSFTRSSAQNSPSPRTSPTHGCFAASARSLPPRYSPIFVDRFKRSSRLYSSIAATAGASVSGCASYVCPCGKKLSSK